MICVKATDEIYSSMSMAMLYLELRKLEQIYIICYTFPVVRSFQKISVYVHFYVSLNFCQFQFLVLNQNDNYQDKFSILSNGFVFTTEH